jgi:hypothetical protein
LRPVILSFSFPQGIQAAKDRNRGTARDVDDLSAKASSKSRTDTAEVEAFTMFQGIKPVNMIR